MRLSLSLAAVAASSVLVQPLLAQSSAAPAAASSTVQLTPYAGFMIFGNYLSGPLGSTISSASGGVYGVQLGFKMSPNISLIGNVAESNSALRIGLPLLGGINVGSTDVLLYDAGLRFDLPRSPNAPLGFFLQGGAGAMHYQINESFLSTSATNFAGNIGGGVDMSMGKGWGLELMAKDYIGQFNFQDATGLGIQGQTAHNIALSAGLRFDF